MTPEFNSKERIDTFCTFVNEHQASLRSYIRVLGARSDWVDDLAQEAFVIAYQQLTDFNQDRDMGNWMRGIARHLVANECRRQARAHRFIYGPLTDYLIQQQDTWDTLKQFEKHDLLRFMSQCIGKLPAHGRKILLRRYYDQESTLSLAAELKTTADAIRHKLMRLRHAVRKCVKLKMQEVAG